MNKYSRCAMKKMELLLSGMSTEQAYILAEIFELADQAIWKEFGDAMADYQGRVHPDVPSPEGSTTTRNELDRHPGDF
jgi:hypothetical protein